MMKRKTSLSKRYVTTNSWEKLIGIWKEIKEIDHALKESYDKERRKREEKVIPLLKDDPSTFYTYAKTFANNRSDIGPLVNEDGDPTMDHEKMAGILAKQYNSVYTKPMTGFIASDPDDWKVRMPVNPDQSSQSTVDSLMLSSHLTINTKLNNQFDEWRANCLASGTQETNS